MDRTGDLWFKTVSHGGGGPILDVRTAFVALCLQCVLSATLDTGGSHGSVPARLWHSRSCTTCAMAAPCCCSACTHEGAYMLLTVISTAQSSSRHGAVTGCAQ
jgi:hypothetical protein